MTSKPFPPLPIAETSAGNERRTGVEIEFSGLTEQEAARLIAEHLGGTVQDTGQHALCVTNTRIGDIEVELDTGLRKKTDLPLLEEGLDLARGIVPVEIITPPLTRDEVVAFAGFMDKLRDAGATGSRSGVLLGFGVHLNPEIVADDADHTLDTVLAYGLLEAWLRRVEDLDATRRLLPFVDPWPGGFVTELAETPPASMDELMEIASRHITTRNYGLDLFPTLAHHDPERFDALFDIEDKTSARPTWHFRLPDCRIDEPDWSLAQPWALWVQVEKVAADASALKALRKAWLDHNRLLPGANHRWSERVAEILEGLAVPMMLEETA